LFVLLQPCAPTSLRDEIRARARRRKRTRV
jgi:hypothetical protein